MAKPDKHRKFDVGNPAQQIEAYINENAKYKLDDSGLNFYQIKQMRPVFAFDYISLNSAELCFDWGQLKRDDYIGFIEGLKKVSEHTYDTLSM